MEIKEREWKKKVVVEFINDMKQTHVDLEIPLEITANDLVLALNEAYGLENGYREYFQLLSCC